MFTNINALLEQNNEASKGQGMFMYLNAVELLFRKKLNMHFITRVENAVRV